VVDESLLLRAQQVRSAIASGAMHGDAFMKELVSVPRRDRDVWVDALLGLELPPPEDPNLPRGSVFYLPCGVEEILAMVIDAPLREGDRFVDLGAGLGRVVILAHLLTGARAHGVEIQAALTHAANALRDALNLSRVTFEHENAANVALDGSHFFLYAPFNGEMLLAVLRRIEEVARRKRIVVCTVALELDVKWLKRRTGKNVSLAIYDSTIPA
jgi:precorrin-6B methylase 2